MSEASKPASNMSTRKLVSLAMLCAIAYVVMYLSKTIFAPIKVAGFLTFDLKDTIIAIGGFIYGPLSAFLVSAVVSLIEMISHSQTGPWGLLMNIISTCAFVCPAAWLYQKRHTTRGAVTGLCVGGVAMVVMMLLWNYLVTPIYQGMPRAAIADMLLPVFLPFNAIKAMMNGALTMVLYKPVVNTLRRAHLAPESRGAGQPKTGAGKLALTLVSLFVLVSAILLALALTGKI